MMGDEHPVLPNKQHCTGCCICRDVCPKSAIEMVADKHGFYYPSVDGDKCVFCKRCEKICPVQNGPAIKAEIKEAHVGIHRDSTIVSQSASGGAFSAIVDAWSADAVCGVRWDGFKAVNDIGHSKEEVQLFSKSKYILSDTNNIYRRAAEELKEGKRVVFSGTPCQVAAFQNYIGDVDNLLLVDIVCHGAPSALLLEMHLEDLERQKGKKITAWSFRDKTPIKGKVSSRSARVDFDDSSWEHYEIKQNAYLQLYYGRMAYREACGNCLFAKPERVSDITICDAHHINEIYPDMTVEKGISTILIHTQKGQGLLTEIARVMTLYDIEYDWVVNHNQQLCKPTIIHPKTDVFYQMIDSGKSFGKAVAIANHRSFISQAIGKIKKFHWRP